MRTCVGCGKHDRQADMTRLQLDGAGVLVPVARPGAGRSAYVHASAECEGALLKTRLLRRSLRHDMDRAARGKIIERLAVARDEHDELAERAKRP